MAALDSNLISNSSSSLVEKILEQGQRLRNSMVQAILNNDPLNKDILSNLSSPANTFRDTKGASGVEKCKSDQSHHRTTNTQRDTAQLNIHKYLEGDEMSVHDEVQALETLRSMSPHSLIQSTVCTKHSGHYKGPCDICKEYDNRLYSASASSVFATDRFDETSTSNRSKQVRNKKPTEISNDVGTAGVQISKGISQTKTTDDRLLLPSKTKDNSSKLTVIKNTFHENHGVLRFVDSLKIHVYSLKLNSAGKRKVMATDNANKPYLTGNNTYFVEYTLPAVLLKQLPKSRAKVNTGLNPEKTVRFCSKKLHNESVYFRQQSVHQISSVNMLDLSSLKIEFRASFRCVKQRTPLLIGVASVNLGSLITNRFLSCEQELVIFNETAPVVLGTMKVTLQFGCDKLYFGKEFIDAISCSKENSKLSDSDSIYKLTDIEPTARTQQSNKVLTNADQNIAQNPAQRDAPLTNNKSEEKRLNNAPNGSEESYLLYALIFVSEVRILSNPINSYLMCRGFASDDTYTSKTVYNSYNPVFNLYQLIPVLLNEEFVSRLRDNYVIVELWQRKTGDADCLIGITKLSLHQLYVAYRNPAIVKHLAKNQHPVIGLDWWETVTDPVSNSDYGQIRALIALGTQSQIETLESNRKLKQSTETIPVKPDYTASVYDEYRYKRSTSNVRHRLPQPVTVPGNNDYQPYQTRSVKFITSENNNGTFGLPKAVIEIDNSRNPNLEQFSGNRRVFFGQETANRSFEGGNLGLERQSSGRIIVEKDLDLASTRNVVLEKGFNYISGSNRSLGKDTNILETRPSNWKSALLDDSHRQIPQTRFANQSSQRNFLAEELHKYPVLESQRICRSFVEPKKRTITVSDKYVQEPDVEIAPSVTSLVGKNETRSGKVDASTQSERSPQTESEKMDNNKSTTTTTTPVNNAPFSQREFFNSFLEQLMSTTRDMNQRNRHVETSTNTENIPVTDTIETRPETTARSASTSVTNVTTTSSGSSSSSVTNPLYVNTAFPQPSIVNNPSSVNNSNLLVRNTSDLLDSLHKALSVGNKNEANNVKNDNSEDTFKVHIVIESALHLPSRKKCKSKRNKTKGTNSNEEILPSTYVTFKGYPETGDCITTCVVAKTTSPRWDYRSDTRLPSELLLNNQKRLIFKVWRKANGPCLQPNFDTDIVLGFAALDLTVLLSGLPNVQGWFNILDFSSKCNGQIKIHVTPLENLARFNEHKRTYVPDTRRIENVNPASLVPVPVLPIPDANIVDDTVSADLLSRALKRKFTELDEITQRLRQRLSAVTNDDSDVSTDDFMDEFERDLNTECADPDGLINFDSDGKINDTHLEFSETDNARQAIASCSRAKSTSDILNEILSKNMTDEAAHNLKSSSSTESSDSSTNLDAENVQEINTQRKLTQLNTHLSDGKLKIDSLLEKLSLLTGDTDRQLNASDRSFSSRYVSGCSINQEVDPIGSQQVLSEIGLKFKDTVDPDLIFNPLLFQQMFSASMESTPRLLDSLEATSSVQCMTLKSLVNSSSTSSGGSGSTADLANMAATDDRRAAPDGAGNVCGKSPM